VQKLRSLSIQKELGFVAPVGEATSLQRLPAFSTFAVAPQVNATGIFSKKS